MRVFLITGFALDKRAFSLLNFNADIYQFIDLIPVVKGETLREYALRLGEGIGMQPEDIIGGVSLGGMLALEIAKAVKVRGVILIASCTHPRQIRPQFLIFAPLAPFVPEFLIRRIFLLIPLILKWQKMLSPTGQALLADIMGSFPPSLLKSLPPLIRNWSGQKPPANFRHIHSEGDWLIKPHGSKDELRILKGKNHLITVSHPKEVRAFIEESVQFFLSRG
jgi:pimeloyl-ACP methyl ester carboxylesterase